MYNAPTLRGLGKYVDITIVFKADVCKAKTWDSRVAIEACMSQIFTNVFKLGSWTPRILILGDAMIQTYYN